MESILKTNDSAEKRRKITLKDYYQGLPDATTPKTDFVNEVAMKCGVTTSTVRNWIFYGMKPTKQESIAILSEVTGIPANELWED